MPRISKRAVEDAVLTTMNEAGEHISVIVPKGSAIEIRARSLHKNRSYTSCHRTTWLITVVDSAQLVIGMTPEDFVPKRFLKDWNRDAFMPFSDGELCLMFHRQRRLSTSFLLSLPKSEGARACVGRRYVEYIYCLIYSPDILTLRSFAETELIAMLTILISRYKVEVKDEPRFAGETFEQRKARVLATKMSLSLTCVALCSSRRGLD